MNDVYFNVSKDGVHVFRTDTYSDPRAVTEIQIALCLAFKATEGYLVERYQRNAMWNSRTVRM